MRSTTTGSAAPISPATTTAVQTARAVNSSFGLSFEGTCAAPGAEPCPAPRPPPSPALAGGAPSAGSGDSSAPVLNAVVISLSKDGGEHAVELGQVLVANLERTLPVLVLDLDFRAQLSLQLLHQVAHAGAL